MALPHIITKEKEIDDKIGILTQDRDLHLASEMPHKAKNKKTNKVYNFGLQVGENGKPQLITQEVL